MKRIALISLIITLMIPPPVYANDLEEGCTRYWVQKTQDHKSAIDIYIINCNQLIDPITHESTSKIYIEGYTVKGDHVSLTVDGDTVIDMTVYQDNGKSRYTKYIE